MMQRRPDGSEAVNASFMCLIDHAGRVVERGADAAFERTLGWNHQDVGGRVVWEHLIDRAEAAQVRARMERVIGGEALGEQDNLWVTRAGERVLVTWTCMELPHIDERRLFLITGAVAEGPREEEGGAEAEERFRAVIESAPVAIIEIGLDHRVRLWNPAAERIFGWAPDEVLGRPPVWVPDDRWEEFRALSAREALGGGYTGFETVRVHRDGTRLDVEVAAAPIRNSSGTVVGAMAVLSDISERRQHEAEVRESRARIVQAADDARRMLERNLHDGAQQRLVGLAVALRLVEAKLSSGDQRSAAEILAGAREELSQALEELRELARGIHPAVLTDRGLTVAVEALAARTPLPVEIDIAVERLPPAVEVALYYVVAESFTNIVKYSGATAARVRLEVTGDGVLAAEVSDDGVGGADPAAGSGLSGLADRVETLGGTRVLAEIPLASAGGHADGSRRPMAGARPASMFGEPG
jgi:PAS domain S-box-containing protein